MILVLAAALLFNSEAMEQAQSAAYAHVPRQGNEAARISVHYVALAVAYFAIGTAAAPWAILRAADYFYQLPVLAWVHIFTLGFITTSIMGAMFCYVPALTGRRLRFPRLAIVQWWLYLVGSSGMISHFLLGSWDGVWMAGVVVVIAVVMFAVNMMPCLAPGFGRGSAETGMLLGILFLLAAGSLGVLLALDKSANFMPGDLLVNLGAHVHLAGIGWFAITICAASYRFAPALTVSSQLNPPRAAIWQIFALAVVAIGMAVSLLGAEREATAWAVAAALLLLVYVAILFRYLAHRTVAISWPLLHVIASLVFLIMAIAAGVGLAFCGAQSEFGSRLAASYGMLALLGWIGNLIIGVSYELFAGMAVDARAGRNWPARAPESIAIPAVTRPAVFAGFNLGVCAMAAGMMAGPIAIAEAGAIVLAIAGLLYAGCAGWTLSFAYRS